MRSRTGLIQSAGLQVVDLVGLTEFADRIASCRWDVAILCHTLSRAERAAILVELRRRNPRAPVLLIARRSYTPPGEAAGFDAVLDPNPQEFVRALRRALPLRPPSPPQKLAAASD